MAEIQPTRTIKSSIMLQDGKGGYDKLLPETVTDQVKLSGGTSLTDELTKINSRTITSVVSELPEELTSGVLYILAN